jgi:hypothetical protein
MTGFKPYPIKEALEIIQNAENVYVLGQISFKKLTTKNKLGHVWHYVALSKKNKTEIIKKFSEWGDDLTMDLEIDGEEIRIG